MPPSPAPRRRTRPAPTAGGGAPARRRLGGRVADLLARAYPDAGCTLDHADPLQLLVATILSAQCTDERVNALTPDLFRRYPDAAAFAAASPRELERQVRPTGFFRNKARAIRAACGALLAEHGGRVPRDLEALVRLPGVGRKTANVIRAACFGDQAVIVDTHVKRVSRRLGLATAADPVKIEFELMAALPAGAWSATSHRLILHGRQVCAARRPRCAACVLAPHCPSAEPERR